MSNLKFPSHMSFKKIVIMEKLFSKRRRNLPVSYRYSGGKLAGLYWVEGVGVSIFSLPASTALW